MAARGFHKIAEATAGDTKRAAKWPKALREIIDVLVAMFARRGLGEAEAQEIAEAATQELATYFGGRIFYIPSNLKARLAARDAEICRDFPSVTPEELAARHGVSVITIYSIIKRENARRTSRRQVASK